MSSTLILSKKSFGFFWEGVGEGSTTSSTHVLNFTHGSHATSQGPNPAPVEINSKTPTDVRIKSGKNTPVLALPF